MKKVENINLGNVPFIINDDAYIKLNEYLKAVRNHFSESSGQDEIMQDIEIRISEIFQEKLGNSQIVTLKILDETIAIMGTPDQFDVNGDEDESRESEGRKESQNSHKYQEEYNLGKRLMRDSEDKVVAGVCSGLSAYFGINDPIWLRILFVLLVIGGGSGVILYIILWILMPKAKSASDRLAMRGKDVNISSIARMVEDEINELGRKFEKMGSDWKKKK